MIKSSAGGWGVGHVTRGRFTGSRTVHSLQSVEGLPRVCRGSVLGLSWVCQADSDKQILNKQLLTSNNKQILTSKKLPLDNFF